MQISIWHSNRSSFQMNRVFYLQVAEKTAKSWNESFWGSSDERTEVLFSSCFKAQLFLNDFCLLVCFPICKLIHFFRQKKTLRRKVRRKKKNSKSHFFSIFFCFRIFFSLLVFRSTPANKQTQQSNFQLSLFLKQNNGNDFQQQRATFFSHLKVWKGHFEVGSRNWIETKRCCRPGPPATEFHLQLKSLTATDLLQLLQSPFFLDSIHANQK